MDLTRSVKYDMRSHDLGMINLQGGNEEGDKGKVTHQDP